MKLQARNLSAALSECARAGKARSTIQHLSGVGMEAKDGTLRIKATNLDVWIGRIVECEGDLPPCCVDLRRFQSIVDSIGKAEIELSLDNKLHVDVPSLKQFNALNVVDPTAFPAWPVQERNKIGVNTGDLADGIDSVAWATISPEVKRGNLENVFVKLSPNFIECFASYGNGLARYSKPALTVDAEFLVPHDFTPALVAALREDGSVLSVAESYVIVDYNNGQTLVKRSAYSWPHREALAIIANKDGNGFVVIDSSILKTACSRAILANSPSNTPTLTIDWKDDGGVTLTATRADLGSYQQTIQIDDAFGEGWAQLNAQKLSNALAKLGDKVRFTPAEGVSFWETNELLVVIAQLGNRNQNA